MKKEITLKNSIIIIDIDDSDFVPFMTIKKVYKTETESVKMITFSIWDDISFDAYSKSNLDNIEFEFDNEDPIYWCLNKLLNGENAIIIYDDNTINNFDKYLCINKRENSIVLLFKGNKYCELLKDKFSIFIKNIGPDSRSKIHDDKFKLRIVDFFLNSKNALLEYSPNFYKTLDKKKIKKLLNIK